MPRQLRRLHRGREPRLLQGSVLRETERLQGQDPELQVHRLGYVGVPVGEYEFTFMSTKSCSMTDLIKQTLEVSCQFKWEDVLI